MSKGSDRVTIRLAPCLHKRIVADIEARKKSAWREELTIGEWVKLAVLEKLEHQRRGRKASKIRRLDIKLEKQVQELTSDAEIMSAIDFGKTADQHIQ